MPPQPSSRRQQLRALPRAVSMLTIGIALWLSMSAFFVRQFALAQEERAGKLTASTGRRLREDEGTERVTRNISNASDLFDAVAAADASDWIVLNLPLGILAINSTLKVRSSVSLLGAPVSENATGTVLSCGPGNDGLIEFSGSSLRLVGLQLQDCDGFGIRITSAVNASILIEDSVFQNFTRVLGAGRVDVFNPGTPTAISDSTVALAVYAGNFSGNLTVRNTRFVENHFKLPSMRRRLYDKPNGLLSGGAGLQPFARDQRSLEAFGSAGTASTSAVLQRRGRTRRVLATMEQADPWVDSMSAWGMTAGSSSGHTPRPRRRLADSSGSPGMYVMPLLEIADQIHPGLQVGPWADDLEAVVSVLCRLGQACALTFEDTTFDSNTGVATGALYVLCDGAASCDVDLTNNTITNNRVLWQNSKDLFPEPPSSGGRAAETWSPPGESGAGGGSETAAGEPGTSALGDTGTQYAEAGATGPAASSSETAASGGASGAGSQPGESASSTASETSNADTDSTAATEQGGTLAPPPAAPESDVGPGGEAAQPPPFGVQLLTRMAAWLTYTYPLLDHYRASEGFSEIQADNMALYPKVVGRTMGAVVFHQRNSPSPGVLPSAARPMMLVTVNGGRLSGNEGAGIMSTAADFMQMAGGNGTWGGGPPRHSADFYISNVNVEDHFSGWPAILLRWARKVEVRNCQVKGSTGAAWLEEVRDSVIVEDSVFEGNGEADGWLDYMAYVPLTASPMGNDIGTLTSHLLKIQMTPLGDVQNSATVRGCRFGGNPSAATGVLLIQASDTPNVDVEDLPGKTVVEIFNSTFEDNVCSSPDWEGVCQSGERPLYMFAVYEASIQQSRFLANKNGGLSLTSVYNAVVNESVFDGNHLTYSVLESEYVDNSQGGAGIFGEVIGTGGFKIIASNFTNNTATIGGGAVYLRLFASLHATASRFERNTAATFDGGALWLMISHGGTQSMIESCVFEENTAGRNGGAISAFDISQSRYPIAWRIRNSSFTNNVALLSPALRGSSIIDQAGGGAVFAYAAAVAGEFSNWTGNKVLGYAGGAIRVVDSNAFTLTNCTLKDNVAAMGGAVALSRISSYCILTFSSFINNTVVEPSWQLSSASDGAPDQSFIDLGFGGALYAFYSTLKLMTSGTFLENSAKFGGAIAVVSSPTFTIEEDDYTYWSRISYVNVSRDVAESVGLGVLGAPMLPYRYLFANNTALIGGGLYLYDTESTDFGLGIKEYKLDANGQASLGEDGEFMETEASERLQGQPAILFLNNTANGGGAAFLEGNGQISLENCRFAANQARVPPLAANYSGLYGLEKDFSMAKALPCYNGGGGAICVVGQANKTIMVSSSDMVNNYAKDGAGMFVAEGLDCVEQASCYNVTLNLVNMTGNAATNRGGGVFWVHEGVLNVASCPSDKLQAFTSNGTALLDAAAGAANTSLGFTVELRTPVRKGPAGWYAQLTTDNQDALLSSVGGAVRAASGPVHSVNGEVVVSGAPVFATGVDSAGVTEQTPNGTVAASGSYLTTNGTLVLPNASNGEPLTDWVPVGGLPVVFSGSILPDPSWLGLPYNNLACANWGNAADAGADVSTTPYFVLSPRHLDYYTSNTDIKINVTVHDWLGQNCTGGNDTQPLVLVQAESMQVSGSVTVPAANGTAAFTALRLRAREGLQNVTMAGGLHAPARDLLATELRIYVRPCAINEFLSPKNLDECIPCDVGAYNLNMSAVTCMACPDDADCSYPDPAACKLETGCDPTGYLVPKNGFWHANFFSEEVIECTNSDACTAMNRSQMLSKMQLAIWQAARQIQFDAATVVSEKAAKAALAKLLMSSSPLARRRRWLQEKAISDELDVILILNATAAMMPEYMQTQCAPGYTGPLCGVCAPGYGWRRVATCSKCPPRALNNLYYALVTLLTLSLLAFTVYSSLKEQRRPGRLVGGLSDPKTKPSKTAKVNPAGGRNDGLGVQASGPSQFHVILAAAAAEDAAAEVAPALALLREHSCTPLGEAGEVGGSTYEYVDPVVAAARNQYGSSPGTPRARPASPAPYPIFDTTARAHSTLLGGPARASRWQNSIDIPRRAAVSFSRMDQHRSGSVGAGHGGIGGSPLAVAGYSNYSPAAAVGGGGGGGTAGPVAEGMISGYDNALYEGPSTVAASRALCVEIEPAVEDEVEEVEEGYRKEDILAVAVAATPSREGRRPVAESTDYTNALYEEPRPTEIQTTDGIGASSPRGAQAHAQATGASPATPNKDDNRSGTVGGGDGVGAAPDACPRVRSMTGGVMLQSVPIMHSNSPPHTPLHASVASVPAAALELPTVVERTRPNEIPRRGAVLGRERAHQSTVVKIFLSYVQVLALLQNVPLEIPGVVDVYYRINNQAISYPGILVSLDCSVPETSVSKAFVRVILTVLAPFYIFAGAVAFFLIFNVLDYYVITPYYAKHPSKKNRKRHLPMPSFGIHLEVYLGRQLIVTFITIFFFFYPSVVQSLMTIFNCNDVNVQTTGNPLANGLGLHTERVWSQDYGHDCYVGSHLALALGLGVPGVLLIAIGWPLMSGLFMTGKLTCMNNISLTEDMTSFFLADFKARFAWWESVIMLRKLFIAVIVTLVDGQSSAGVQLLLVICILVIAAGIHLAAMPYHHTYTNNLELLSLGTLLATLYFSLYFGFSTSISDGGRIAISILILVINIVMVLVFVYYIVEAYYYAALVKVGLNDLDSETRRKMTAAELRQKILENLNAQGSTASFPDGPHSQSHPPVGHYTRSSNTGVASFYTAAVWASLRMGSTTNKVLTKMRTLLREPEPGSQVPSREGSISGREPSGVPIGGGSAAAAATAAAATQLNSRDSDAILSGDDDPEAARVSATGRKRAVSATGGDAATLLPERTSLTTVKSSGSGKEAATAYVRSHSQSSPGIAAKCSSPSASVAASPHDRSSPNGGRLGVEPAAVTVTAAAVAATPSPRDAPKVISRGSSAASLDVTNLQAAEVDQVAALAAAPTPLPPPAMTAPAAPMPAVQLPAVTLLPTGSRPSVRAQSRLAQASGQADRSGELLPPPPSFPGRGAAKP